MLKEAINEIRERITFMILPARLSAVCELAIIFPARLSAVCEFAIIFPTFSLLLEIYSKPFPSVGDLKNEIELHIID